MDLAKIRKKSLQLLRDPGYDRCSAMSVSPELVPRMLETVPSAPVFSSVDNSPNESIFIANSSPGDSPGSVAAIPMEHVVASLTPLEAILAGRTAAGCDEEALLADDVSSEIVAESRLEFLTFRVSDEIYGISIMDIKEIIKPRVVTEVPRAPLFVSGVLSLRGTIIPVIDMRIRLDLGHEKATGKERIVVIKGNNSFSGLLVDEVIQVVQLQLDSVEAAPAVLDGIDREFVSGLGRSDGRLIIILNLENIADINLY